MQSSDGVACQDGKPMHGPSRLEHPRIEKRAVLLASYRKYADLLQHLTRIKALQPTSLIGL
ncbi:hypothetical protein [Caballeronia sp. GAWG1-1]|uniref:hypothetical protein n=1 Tax=Caballeronia sp. GAWG1-1 TaxID=2921742 RepID=UPI00202876B4|nr:hypothetical protein [Caballeronia sp. GAWG1-1]